MKILFPLLTLLPIISSSSLPLFPKINNVVILTDQTWEEAIRVLPKLFIKYYAPWCGHCQALAPEFSKAASSSSSVGVTFASIDLDSNKKTMLKAQIFGFPVLIYYENGSFVSHYSGGRKASSMLSWLAAQGDRNSTS